MMGNKKLAEIRQDVAAEAEKAGLDPQEWLEEQLRKLELKQKTDPRDMETLMLLRDAVASTVRTTSPRASRTPLRSGR